MKKIKYLILVLLTILFALWIFRTYLARKYPLCEDLYDKSKNRLFNDRHKNKFDAIFWNTDVRFGLLEEDFSTKIFVDTTIVWNKDTIKCNMAYSFSEGRLYRFGLKLPYSKDIEEKLISHYGEMYVYSTINFYDYEDISRTWYSDTIYSNICCIKRNEEKNMYITIGSFSKDINFEDLRWYQCEDSWFREQEKIETESTTIYSSKKTYKYGDSDVYQGSSQQAEDLRAIDAYGASNPDFW